MAEWTNERTHGWVYVCKQKVVGIHMVGEPRTQVVCPAFGLTTKGARITLILRVIRVIAGGALEEPG